MKQLTLRQKRELIILSAIERRELCPADIEDRLSEARLPLSTEQLQNELLDLGREALLAARRIGEGSGGSIIAVHITEAGQRRLAALREICPQTLVEHTEDFLRANTPAPESESDPDGVVGLCLSVAALDAWWSSLGIDGKAEAFMSHYETLAAGEREPKAMVH